MKFSLASFADIRIIIFPPVKNVILTFAFDSRKTDSRDQTGIYIGFKRDLSGIQPGST